MATWPSTIPKPLIEGDTESPPNRVIRTEMDAGAPKTRRKFTDNVRPRTFSFIMTEAQLATFDAFYLANDAVEFDFTDIRTAAAVKMRFKSVPQYTRISHAHHKVTVELEIMP